MNATTTIKLTKEEIERIETALNYYDVNFINKKRQENPENSYLNNEWNKGLELWARFYDAQKRVEKKENR